MSNAWDIFPLLIESAEDYAIVTLDLDHRVTSWNSGAARILGYSEAEILGRSGDIFFQEKDRKAGIPQKEMETALQQGRATDERWHVRKDGTHFFASGVMRPLPDPAKRGVCKIFRDITERKETEDRLRESEQRFRWLIENVREYALLQIDLEGTIVSWNPGAERLFGYSSQEALGKSFSMLLNPDDRRTDYLSKELSVVHEKGRSEDARWLLRKDGSRFWARWVTEPIQDGSTTLQGYAKVLRDETERKQTEDALHQSRASLERLTQNLEKEVVKRTQELRAKERELHQAQKIEALGQLAGGVAHDFNNLMTGILGITQEVQGSMQRDDPRREDLQEIIKAADQAFHVTRQLLTFARKEISQPKSVDVNAVIENVRKMLGRVIGENIHLQVFEGDVGPVRMDAGHLEQILMNLAINARDAMPQGGSFTLRTSAIEIDDTSASPGPNLKPGAYVIIEISDTGHGMPPGVLSHIFEPFFTTKEKGKGTGLGLSTVHGIVTQSGGDIKVESVEGQGTTFRVYLPLGAGPDPGAEADDTQSFNGNETLLVVEDEDIVRNVIIKKLKRKGYSVLAARNGIEAISLARQHPGRIDLILTDVVMPKMNGRQLVEQLLHDRPQTPVLYMSGYTENVIDRSTVDSKLNFIEKSAIAMELVGKVRQLLDAEAKCISPT